jgi:hypothetical protein
MRQDDLVNHLVVVGGEFLHDYDDVFPKTLEGFMAAVDRDDADLERMNLTRGEYTKAAKRAYKELCR